MNEHDEMDAARQAWVKADTNYAGGYQESPAKAGFAAGWHAAKTHSEFPVGARVLWTDPNFGVTKLEATVVGTEGRRVLIRFDTFQDGKVRRARKRDVELIE